MYLGCKQLNLFFVLLLLFTATDAQEKAKATTKNQPKEALKKSDTSKLTVFPRGKPPVMATFRSSEFSNNELNSLEPAKDKSKINSDRKK